MTFRRAIIKMDKVTFQIMRRYPIQFIGDIEANPANTITDVRKVIADREILKNTYRFYCKTSWFFLCEK